MASAAEHTRLAYARNVNDVARAPAAGVGRGGVRQTLEQLLLRLGPRGLTRHECRAYQLECPVKSFSEKRAFAGETGLFALNAALAPPANSPALACLSDGFYTAQLLGGLGLPVAHTQAFFCALRKAGKVPVLRDAAQLEAFLRNDALYPVFCKPLAERDGKATLRIECIDGHTLSLGNGETRHVSLFADEIQARHSNGYLVQTAIDAHPQMVKVAGRAIGALRIVTVRNDESVEPIYALWHLPAPNAMSDCPENVGAGLADIALETGAVGHSQSTTCDGGTAIEAHPVTNSALKGFVLPFWSEAARLAADVHGVFPDLGICATDIAISPGGPVILGCDARPAHGLYQRASGRGIWNNDFAPVWKSLIARRNTAWRRDQRS